MADGAFVVIALAAGAFAYLLKDTRWSAWADAVGFVAAGWLVWMGIRSSS